VALIPGVRQVAVRDGWGGLDLSQSIFGDFDFIERLFATDRDLASPFFVTVLVAPTDAAIWAGPHGLKAEVEQAIADVRPIGVFPNVVRADQVFVAVEADVLTSGLPLPSGDVASRNSSPAAQALKARLTARLHAVLDNLTLSQPVRSAAIVAALMAEPGVIDVGAVRLVRFPPALDGIGSGQPLPGTPGDIGVDQNLSLTADQIAVLVEAPDLLTVR
jgi:hypothetical protein